MKRPKCFYLVMSPAGPVGLTTTLREAKRIRNREAAGWRGLAKLFTITRYPRGEAVER